MANKKLPKGFYWRGNTIWLRTDPILGREVSTGTADIVIAQQFRTLRERASRDPVHTAAATATFGKWAGLTLKHKRTTKSEGTADFYDVKLGQLVRVIGAKRKLINVDAPLIDKYIEARRAEGVKNGTIKHELTCLTQLLKLARRAGEYPHDPAVVMPFGFSSDYVPVTRTLSQEDFPKLMEELTPEQGGWVCYALATAGDISDVERAEVGDYDPVRGVVRMRGSKNKYRSATIPVPDQFRPLIEAALPFVPFAHWPRVSKDLPEACVRAGIPKVTPKDLRRSAATWLQEAGARIDTLAKFMRHGGVKMAHDVYGQARPEALGEQLRQQTGSHTETLQSDGPLGEIGIRRGLKNRSSGTGAGATSRKKASKGPGRHGRTWPGHSDPLHLVDAARARVRSQGALAAVDPTARPGLAICRGLEAAYLVGSGDESAQAELLGALAEASELIGEELCAAVGQ